MLGLGEQPADTVFNGNKGVFCEEGDFLPKDGALDNFWRGAENFRSSATESWFGNVGMMVSSSSFSRPTLGQSEHKQSACAHAPLPCGPHMRALEHRAYTTICCQWAVSQAAPLRRVTVDNDLILYQ